MRTLKEQCLYRDRQPSEPLGGWLQSTARILEYTS
jgi:hypothetical protein